MAKPRQNKSFNKRKGPGKFGDSHAHREKDDRFSYDAVCDQCGKPCTVPFKPTGNRPVLCRRCFQKEDNFAPKRYGDTRHERPSFRREERGERRDPRPDTAGLERQLRIVNRKLDEILSLLAPAAPKKKGKPGGKKKKAVIPDEFSDDDDFDDEDEYKDADDDDGTTF